MAITPQSIDDLMEELAVNLSDPANPALITDLNQGAKFKQFAQAVMTPVARLWDSLVQVDQNSNYATMSGEPLKLFVNALGFYERSGSPSVGSVLAIPKSTGTTGTLNAGDVLIYNNATFVVLTRTLLASPYSVIPVQSGNLGTQWNLPAGSVLVSPNVTLNQGFNFRVGSSLNALGNPQVGLSQGEDAENDSAIKSRFADYIKSLTRAVYDAVYQAALGIPGIISLALVEFQPFIGMMTLYVDDGSSNLVVNPTLEDTIQTTLKAWRASGAGLRVLPMEKVLGSVILTIVGAPGNDALVIKAGVEAAVTAALNNYKYGQTFYPTSTVPVAFEVAGVLSVSIAAPSEPFITIEPNQVFRPASVTANVTISS